MKALAHWHSLLNTPAVYVEIGQSSLKVRDGEDGLELSLERLENGALSPLCAERLTGSLRVFLKRHSWRPRIGAICAIGARGVSMRRVAVPRASSKEDLQRLLLLQIEREFPLPPQELAWGCQRLGGSLALPNRAENGQDKNQEFMVVAVKKDLLRQYATVLQDAGLTPVFTVGALARSSLCRQPPISFAMLDIGRQQSEVIRFDHGIPETLRVLPWGGENITRALAKQFGVTRAEAENTKVGPRNSAAASASDAKIDDAITGEVKAFAVLVAGAFSGQKMYLTGGGSRAKNLAPHLAETIGAECERIEFGEGEGHSATVEALERGRAKGLAPMVLSLDVSKNGESATRPLHLQWLGLALLLGFASLTLRYGEAVIFKPRVSKRMSEMRAYGATLPRVERELSLLQYLKTNQPPYLDTIHAIAQAAAPGTRVDALSLNSRGDVAIRATMKDSQQVMDWRSKLIDSGAFAAVVVDEQTPSADRQKMQVRISARWRTVLESAKPAPARNEADAPAPLPAPEKAPKQPEPSK